MSNVIPFFKKYKWNDFETKLINFFQQLNKCNSFEKFWILEQGSLDFQTFPPELRYLLVKRL